MKKKVILNGLIRGIITFVCMSVITYFVYKDNGSEQLRSMISATIISTSVVGFSALYDYDIWSTKKKIIVHTVAMLCTVYPALIYSEWFGNNYFLALVVFACTGAVLASLGYLVSKYVFKNVPDKQ